MRSSTYKPTVPRWAQRQQFSLANIFMAYIETQSLSKIVFRPTVWKRYMDDIFLLWDSKPDIVAFFEQANLHYPTIKFTTEIHWDNVCRHSCIQRYKIKRKSYPWCKDYGNIPAHILRLVTHRFVKRVWGKCFKIQKNAWWLMMYRCYQHNLKDKLQSEITIFLFS